MDTRSEFEVETHFCINISFSFGFYSFIFCKLMNFDGSCTQHIFLPVHESIKYTQVGKMLYRVHGENCYACNV